MLDTDAERLKMVRGKAASLLARRSYSIGEMRSRLLEIADAPAVETVLDRLVKLKLLNDEDYAYNFAFSRVGRDGWGPEKIRDALIRRQVPASTTGLAIERVRALVGEDFGLADYLDKYFVKRGLPRNAKETRRLITHLRRRGFHRNSIDRILNQLLPSESRRLYGPGD
jgi:SOS response regulatory protein OraA/RecX